MSRFFSLFSAVFSVHPQKKERQIFKVINKLRDKRGV